MALEQTLLSPHFPLSRGSVLHAAAGNEGNGNRRTPERPKKGRYEVRGTLKEEAGGKNGTWRGKISNKNRIKDGTLSQEQVDHFTDPDVLDTYFTAADERKPMRCVDGRTSDVSKAKIDSGIKIEDDRPVGPQIPGGTPGTALVHRIISDENPHGTTLTKDIKDIVAEFDHLGIAIGGHIDEHNGHASDMTGCGAIDRIPEIFDTLDDPAAREQIKTLTVKLLGNGVTPAIDTIFGKIARVHLRRDEYLEKRSDGTYPYRRAAKEILQDHNPDNVETMVGKHAEVALVVNTVPDTTLNRARMNQDSNCNVQVFNYDVWVSQHIAEKLYPDDPAMQQMYVVCRVMLAIATMMVLTDGSIRLIVRTKGDETDESKNPEKKPQQKGEKAHEPPPTTANPPREPERSPEPEVKRETIDGGKPKPSSSGSVPAFPRRPRDAGEIPKLRSAPERRSLFQALRDSMPSLNSIVDSIRRGTMRLGGAVLSGLERIRDIVLQQGLGRAREESDINHEIWAGGVAVSSIIGGLTFVVATAAGSTVAVPLAVVAGAAAGLITAYANWRHEAEGF